MNLPYEEIEITATRSRGPGGQNVNKTNSAIQLRWNLKGSSYFPLHIYDRLLFKLAGRLTVEGEIIIRSENFRDQEQNKKDAFQKLNALIQEALFVPKKRLKTKPTRGSKERRLKQKKGRADIKKSRSTRYD